MSSDTRPGGSLYADAIHCVTRLRAETGLSPGLDEVAASLGVPRDELAKLFPDDCRLLQATAENAMMLLHDMCVRTVVTVDPEDPVGQFEALSASYVDWACAHPQEFFIIATMPDHEFRANETLMRYERGLQQAMLRILGLAQARGLLAPGDDLGVMLSVAHTFAFGVINKMLMGDLARWSQGRDRRDAAHAAMHAFIRKVLAPDRAAG